MANSDIIAPCVVCGRVYNHTILKQCPGCAGSVATDTAKRHKQIPEKNLASVSDGTGFETARLENLLQELINETRKTQAAANRTTYAIRSAISYVAIVAITATLVAIEWSFCTYMAVHEHSDWFGIGIVVVGLTTLVGLGIAQYQFFKQWRLSRVV